MSVMLKWPDHKSELWHFGKKASTGALCSTRRWMAISLYWRHLSYQHGSSCLVMEVLFHLLDLLASIDGRFGFSKILLSTATVSLS